MASNIEQAPTSECVLFARLISTFVAKRETGKRSMLLMLRICRQLSVNRRAAHALAVCTLTLRLSGK